MSTTVERTAPGRVRDAILGVLRNSAYPLTPKEIEDQIAFVLGSVPSSSVRSYLRLNTPKLFTRTDRGQYTLIGSDTQESHGVLAVENSFHYGNTTLYLGDCFDWLRQQPDNSIHAIVTDPPYGLVEYSPKELTKLRRGRGGTWRIPPSFDGNERSPLPRFTTLTDYQIEDLRNFFTQWAKLVIEKIVPGANVVVASNPLLSFIVSSALADANLERRGEIIRLTMTMRGGDRPKDAHEEFSEVSVMPRSMWEPWIVFRKPVEGRVQDNLRKWKTGGFRRPSNEKPFGDVIQSSPTRAKERELAPHPSLKPQSFLRTLVRGVLPLGEGIVCDPFAGSGSTLAAAEAVAYKCIGIERDLQYFEIAKKAIPRLAKYEH
jgi:site-specific DNA-methyltransferase (adenine-specific)